MTAIAGRGKSIKRPRKLRAVFSLDSAIELTCRPDYHIFTRKRNSCKYSNGIIETVSNTYQFELGKRPIFYTTGIS
jgi:hypothetical protein